MMKVKRFTGDSNQEVMNKVKLELGSEAIILHTRTIKKPKFFGLIKKEEVEVIAALDEKTTNNKLNNELNLEIKKLRSSVEYIIDNLNEPSKAQDAESIMPELVEFVDILKNNGVKEDIARSIIYNIDKQVNLEDKDRETIKDIIKYNIKAYLGEPKPIELTSEQKIVFFIGPTGVGKTTTLAKIAAHFTLNKKCDIGLITADTYRIAAVEQLKTYAEILKLPVKVIYEIKGIYESLSNFKDKDIILIDTAGRSHKNIEQMEELKNLIQTVKNKEVFLVLNIGTDIENINSIISQYGFVDDYKIIFTKVDESEKIGNILNTKFYTNKQLSYITYGQNVPDDIELIDTEKISKVLIGEISYE
ncbi:flagellar biosynthesis protein FlhF [Gottschalkia acidurici 9a]|uniref:Flagellar biosynthesis protein FlhF n=1 Tax=Gottschalkia acidurici (strain ATCC 7906 / DSM 604 / BCRC 14475 / CIP 104303 / KCTC 5404 / NCIMB 10678 / 9a) TaxID=1128398 RepID=K0AZ94_GOTA9|nr:flagellar biosynthesis protein FlhF [Gottschalkia acidurici]AFS78589.1 flagellar biosynthesis protein FlhF [Gottschalkia acidurici 9a]